MLVVNICGMPWAFNYNGRNLVIPDDHKPHEVPDVLYNSDIIGNVLKVLIPPNGVIVNRTTSNITEIIIDYPKEISKPIQKPSVTATEPPLKPLPIKPNKSLKGKRLKLKKASKSKKKQSTKTINTIETIKETSPIIVKPSIGDLIDKLVSKQEDVSL